MTIDTIFFDLGDTLVGTRPEVYTDSARRITAVGGRNVEVDDLRKAIKDEWCYRNGEDIQWVTTEETETKYWKIFYRDVLRRLDIPEPPQPLLDVLSYNTADPDSFVCFADVNDVLSALQSRGIGIGLISNAFPSARRIMERFDLTHWFAPLVLSYEYFCAKPCPEIYRYALRYAGISPEQALFVDDRDKFIAGAVEVGMEARLIDREGNCRSKYDKICGLDQLLELL